MDEKAECSFESLGHQTLIYNYTEIVVSGANYFFHFERDCLSNNLDLTPFYYGSPLSTGIPFPDLMSDLSTSRRDEMLKICQKFAENFEES